MNQGPVILVIDDEVQIRRLLRISLEAHGYKVIEAATAKEGIEQCAAAQPDLIVLDLGLPDSDGIDVIRNIREWSVLPVIVLSVRNSEQDKIDLLDAGADDYLTKPFGIGELLARIRAALRHSVPDSGEGTFRVKDISIDFVKRLVLRNGLEVKLTPTEYSLVRLLVKNSGKVVTHNQIMHELWPGQPEPDPSYLRVYVLQLRRKFEEDPAKPRLIITEPGIGYRLITE